MTTAQNPAIKYRRPGNLKIGDTIYNADLTEILEITDIQPAAKNGYLSISHTGRPEPTILHAEKDTVLGVKV